MIGDTGITYQQRNLGTQHRENKSEKLMPQLTTKISSNHCNMSFLAISRGRCWCGHWILFERDAFLANEATKRWTSSNQVLMEIACTRCPHELLLVRQAYQAKFKKSLEEDVGAHVTGDYRKDLKIDAKDDFLATLRNTIKCLSTPTKYFEKVLRLEINKMETNEWALIRVVTTRAEVDMVQLKEEYYRRNNIPLEKAIAGDTSGDNENMYLALIGH